MRSKLTILIVAAATLGLGAVSRAAPIPVATYSFQSLGDVQAFQKVFGRGCKRKWAGNQALGIGVGKKTSSCVYRSSVVADSSGGRSDLGMVATTTVRGGTKKLQRKSFVGVGVRRSEATGYLLRVLPNLHKWQYFRDPKGSAGPKLIAAGPGKFIKVGSKPNVIAIRAFSYGGSSTIVIASVNGHTVVSGVDSAADQPDGRQTVVTDGVKGSAPGVGVRGAFDNVTVQVPNPL